MAKKINLRSSKVKAGKRQTSTYGTQTPLSSTAVERGSTRWLNGSRVDIDGVLDVTGTATVSGTLGVSGTTTLSGSTTIAGPTGITGALTIAGSMSVTGPSTFSGTLGINGATTITGQLDVTGPTKLAGTLDITGDTTISGALGIEGNTTVAGDLNVDGPLDVTGDTTLGGTTEITGVTTLKNELIVQQGKKITLGGLVLENQGPGTAAVQMPGGGILSSLSLLTLNHDRVTVAGQETVAVESLLINLNAPQTSVNGKLAVTNEATFGARVDFNAATYLNSANTNFSPSLPTNANPPNLYISPSGRLYKSTWTP